MPHYMLIDIKEVGEGKEIPFEADNNNQAEEYGEAYYSSLDPDDTNTESIRVFVLIIGRWSFTKRQFQSKLGPLVAKWTARRFQRQEAQT